MYEGTRFTADFNTEVSTSINGIHQYSFEGQGLVLLVYDQITKEKIDLVTFLEKDGFITARP